MSSKQLEIEIDKINYKLFELERSLNQILELVVNGLYQFSVGDRIAGPTGSIKGTIEKFYTSGVGVKCGNDTTLQVIPYGSIKIYKEYVAPTQTTENVT